MQIDNTRSPFVASVLSCLLFFGCSNLYSSHADNRDFAVDTYPLPQTSVNEAATRAQRFWTKHSSDYGPQPALLAVEAYMVDTGELVPLFSARMSHSETTASYYAQHGFRNDDQSVTGVVIYDTKAGRLLDSTGYIFVDTPSIGTIIHVRNLVARYIGRG
jgi:hypothetical protein